MRWNSAEGMRMVHLYSVSGMPRWSESMSMSLSSKSETLSPLGDSKMSDKVSLSSCVVKLMTSSLPAHLRIFDRFSKLIPRLMGLSQR